MATIRRISTPDRFEVRTGYAVLVAQPYAGKVTVTTSGPAELDREDVGALQAWLADALEKGEEGGDRV